jgi:hypothetical protein
MTDWNKIFSEHIGKFTSISILNDDELKTILQEYKDKYKFEENKLSSIKLYNCMYNSGVINKNQVSLICKNNKLKLEMYNCTFMNKFSTQIDSVFDNKYIVSSIKKFKNPIKDSICINNVQLEKINFFIQSENEYIKVNPEVTNNSDIMEILKKNDSEYLFYPVLTRTSDNKFYLTLKIKGIVIHYNKFLSKYPFIKRVFDAKRIVDRKLNKEIKEKDKCDKVFLETKFNTYKIGRNKINNSNNKLINLLTNA